MDTRYYLVLDEDNHLTNISTVGDGPHIESLDGYDFSGYRLQAHKWDGETLFFDPERYAELSEKEAREAAQETILRYRAQLRQTDDVVLGALEGLMSARTVTGFIAALIETAAAIHTTLAERAELREKIKELMEG